MFDTYLVDDQVGEVLHALEESRLSPECEQELVAAIENAAQSTGCAQRTFVGRLKKQVMRSDRLKPRRKEYLYTWLGEHAGRY